MSSRKTASVSQAQKFRTDDVHYPDLGGASDWLKENFLTARAQVATSQNLGCFLRLQSCVSHILELAGFVICIIHLATNNCIILFSPLFSYYQPPLKTFPDTINNALVCVLCSYSKILSFVSNIS